AAAPMVIVAGHAPFTWGKDAAQSVYHAALLEEIAKMAYLTRTLDPNAAVLKQAVLDKHYLRKHGKNAYYGQE
ncbi:MAG: class II aldolase/adducin family protein, partial [Pseudomonadota bacterium]|nr:class II aldolase/adducin family protein [Pseudomonadota bacterium]